MMWIGLSIEPGRETVETAFARHAPGLKLHWGEWLDSGHDEAAVTLQTNPSEFPFRLDVWLPAGFDAYDTGLKIAGELSRALACSTICDGTRHGPTRAPFWSIVWVEGQAFLADDCNTVFVDYNHQADDEADDEPRTPLGPVKIVGPLPIEL